MATVACTSPDAPGPIPSHPTLVKDRLMTGLYSRCGKTLRNETDDLKVTPSSLLLRVNAL